MILSTEDIFRRISELYEQLELEKPKAVQRGARKLFKLLRKVDAAGVDSCELYEAGRRVALLFELTDRPKLGVKAARWAWGLDCDSKNEAEYHYLLGTCYLQMRGKQKEAAELLRKAVELETDRDALVFTYDHAALAYARIGDDARAVEYLRKLIELVPSPTSFAEKRYRVQMAHIAIAESYWRMRRDNEAISVLEALLRCGHLEPGVRSMIHSVRGDIHAYRGEYKEAGENYRSGIEAPDPDIEHHQLAPNPLDRDKRVPNLRRLKRDLICDLRCCERQIRGLSRQP